MTSFESCYCKISFFVIQTGQWELSLWLRQKHVYIYIQWIRDFPLPSWIRNLHTKREEIVFGSLSVFLFLACLLFLFLPSLVALSLVLLLFLFASVWLLLTTSGSFSLLLAAFGSSRFSALLLFCCSAFAFLLLFTGFSLAFHLFYHAFILLFCFSTFLLLCICFYACAFLRFSAPLLLLLWLLAFPLFCSLAFCSLALPSFVSYFTAAPSASWHSNFSIVLCCLLASLMKGIDSKKGLGLNPNMLHLATFLQVKFASLSVSFGGKTKCLNACGNTCMCAYMHTYRHTDIHIDTYRQTDIQTYTQQTCT